MLARAARSARRTTHFDLDFPRAPQTEPYWCHKHKRECRPVETASQFLRTIKVEFNKVVDTVEEPLQQQSQQKDLLPLLQQLLRREEANELSAEEKQSTLREWNAMVLGERRAA